jgi:hypothetical protein
MVGIAHRGEPRERAMTPDLESTVDDPLDFEGDEHAATSPVIQFRIAMLKAGLGMYGQIKANGKVHRFSHGKSTSRSGWYALDLTGIPAGMFGNLRTGESWTWRADVDAWMDERVRPVRDPKVTQ